METIVGDSFTNIDTISFEQFRRECAGYELTSALRFVQRESAAMGDQILKKVNIYNDFLGSGHVHISQYAHAFIAKHLLLNSSFLHRRPFQKSDYEKLVVYFNHLETDLNYLNPRHPSAQRWLVRASYSQGRYQRIPGHILGRYYILFKELGRSSTACSAMVEKAIGLNVDEIMLIGISFYIVLLLNGHLDIRHIEQHSIPSLNDVLQPAKLGSFLQSTAISKDEFKSECGRLSWDNVLLKKYEFNPLWLYPIIDTGILSPGLRYIVPSLGDFVYRFTEGIYYSTMDYYNQGGAKNKFSAEFGPLFENYVGYHLEDVKQKNSGLAAIQPETEYNCGKNRWKSSDWLLVSSNDVIQIECKKATTPIKFRAAVSDNSGSDFDIVLDNFARYVIKLYQKSIHIQQGNLEFASGGSKTVFSVFVVMDDFYCMDARFKPLITAKAAQKIPQISSFRYHILNCTSFEVVCQFLKTHPDVKFSDLLRLKEEDQNYHTDFDRFLEEHFSFTCSKIDLIWSVADRLWALAIDTGS